MTTTKKHDFNFWAMQGPGWLLLIYLIYAQGITAFGYQLGVAMGTQEPVETITEVGAAFSYGFALGDLLTYIPILIVGLIGAICAAITGAELRSQLRWGSLFIGLLYVFRRWLTPGTPPDGTSPARRHIGWYAF
jgi:hypothetical protein